VSSTYNGKNAWVVDSNMVIFATRRTAVRPWRHDEAGRLFDILRRDEVAAWLGSNADAMKDPAEAVERIARWRDRSRHDPRFGTWAIEEKATGVVAGSVTLAWAAVRLCPDPHHQRTVDPRVPSHRHARSGRGARPLVRG
jgi:RimJ/RimL family protein N-acetyltransferase